MCVLTCCGCVCVFVCLFVCLFAFACLSLFAFATILMVRLTREKRYGATRATDVHTHTQRHTITSDIAAAIRSIPIPAVRVGTCRADMLAMAPEMAIEVSRGRIVLMLLHMRVSENWGCLMLGSLY